MIEELLEYIGIEDIRPQQNEVAGRCPMHEKNTGEREHRPRHWSVNRRTGAHHCFSCGYSGSLIRLIMDVTKMGLWDAHQLLRRFDVDLDRPPDEDDWVPPVAPRELKEKLAEFGPPPERAIQRRHLTMTSLTYFGVKWDYELSSWIFPIYGPAGDLWGWQSKNPEWVVNHPPGIRKSLTLFGIQLPLDGASVVLVESPLDAIYLASLGYPAMASFGAGVSDAQMRLIIERFDEVILALDNDDAGRNETRRLLHARWHHRFPTQVFNYREFKGKDPGELTPAQIDTGLSDSVMAAFW